MSKQSYAAIHLTEAVTPKKDGNTAIEVEAVPAVPVVGSHTGLKDLENKGTKRIFEEHNAIKLVEGLSLEDKSNVVDRWFYSYLDPVFKIGNSRTLMMEDLGAVNARDKCSYVEANFDKYWAEEMKLPKRKQSLWRVLWRTVGYDQLFCSLWYYAIYVGVTYGPILILNALVQHFQGTHLLSQAELWIFVCLVFILPMLGSVTAAMSNAVLAHVSVQFRNVLVTKIYRKSLALSPAARQKSSTGQIINMFSTDTKQLQMFLNFMNNVALAPVQIIIALALIYEQVGPSTFVGLGFMIIMIPLNGLIFTQMSAIRRIKMKETDKRVKLMNEILSGIRVIKYYAWEYAFTQKIRAIRSRELDLLRQLAYIVAVGFTLIMMSAPLVQPILIFFVYVKLGNQLDAARAFTTLSLFNVLAFPFAFLPMGVAQYSQSMVSCKRMLDFFNNEELVPYVDKTEDTSDGTVVSMEHAHLCWISDEVPPDVSKMTVEQKKDHDWMVKKKKKEAEAAAKEAKKKAEIAAKKAIQDAKDAKKAGKTLGARASGAGGQGAMVATTKGSSDDEKKPGAGGGKGNGEAGEAGINRSYYTLMDVSFRVKKGQLIAVVGSVGSGKSSLLSGLLGEMQLQQGKVRVCGKIAYCDQRPWIMNTTVRDNILFGLPYDEDRFDMAVHASSLEDDIKVLPGGVLTEIGEKGINLSGGQKARVALARAIYRDADVYLLDDPLSAVDAHVGQHIFTECILGALKDKTRVLVTHQVHLLHMCDLVCVLEDGKVKAFGSFEELQQSGIDIEAFVPNTAHAEDGATATATPATVVSSDVLMTTKEKSHSMLSKETAETTTTMKAVTAKTSVNAISSDDQQGLMTPSASPMTRRNKHRTEGTMEGDDMGDEEKEGEKKEENKEENKEEKKESEGQELAVVSVSMVKEEKNKEGKNKEEKDKEEKNKEGKNKEGKDKEGKDKTDKGDTAYTMSLSAKAAAEARHTENREGTKITTMEERATGDIQWPIYKYYVKAGGWGWFGGVLLALICAQVLQIISAYWLQYWGTVSTRHTLNNEPLDTNGNVYFLNMYAVFSMCGVVALVGRSLLLAQHRLGTSTQLHQNLLDVTLGAPVAFYDVTPLGRILNRFSSDMQVVDEDLSQTISQLSNSVFQCIGAVGAISGATYGTFLILCVPLAFLYDRFQRFFRKSNTAIARLQSVSLSPIYADFSQALAGLNSIRAYDVSKDFITKLQLRVDYNSVAFVMNNLASQWLAVRLDLIGSFISFFIAIIACATPGGFIPAGYLALGLSYSFQLTTYLKFAVRMMATMEAGMNAVERQKFYIDNVEREDDTTMLSTTSNKGTEASKVVPDTWPMEGAIVGQNVQMRYRDGPLVLKGIDFSIKGGEKIGIAGRTGSGKSSLMIALFRIQEVADGTMFIDGVNTKTVPLRTLRSRIGIIPQDPVIFSASVRFNLDPFDVHSDGELWDVLQSVDMKDHVSSLPAKLLEEVAEGGDNFSTGQRQLICIARALLRKPKILVLDEATASIDNETDALIQRMVRVNFKHCTVLTIAHRLHTIVDSDRIMVLDGGILAEMDTPDNLLAKSEEEGLFRALWERHQRSHGGNGGLGSKNNSKENLVALVEEEEKQQNNTTSVNNSSTRI